MVEYIIVSKAPEAPGLIISITATLPKNVEEAKATMIKDAGQLAVVLGHNLPYETLRVLVKCLIGRYPGLQATLK